MTVKLDKLMEVASDKGLDIMAFEYTDMYDWRIKYLDHKKAGVAPVEEYCRDRKDYELRMAIWIKDGTVLSSTYPDFDFMISEELKRLKKL